jgi:hypothetical protein
MKPTQLAKSLPFVALLFILTTSVGIAGCNSDQDVQQAVDQALQKQQEREAQKKLKAEQKRLKRELNKLKRRSRSGSEGSGGYSDSGSSYKSCGNGVSANSVTSCGFASNAAVKYRRYGAGTYKVWSPALGRYVYMSCSGGTCAGGNGAIVRIR